MRNAKLIRDVKQLAKQRYTSVGSYPLFLVLTDGECLCATCVREEFAQIGRATRDSARDGWCAAAVDINWESELFCGHCNQQIESAYGVADASEQPEQPAVTGPNGECQICGAIPCKPGCQDGSEIL